MKSKIKVLVFTGIIMFFNTALAVDIEAGRVLPVPFYTMEASHSDLTQKIFSLIQDSSSDQSTTEAVVSGTRNLSDDTSASLSCQKYNDQQHVTCHFTDVKLIGKKKDSLAYKLYHILKSNYNREKVKNNGAGVYIVDKISNSYTLVSGPNGNEGKAGFECYTQSSYIGKAYNDGPLYHCQAFAPFHPIQDSAVYRFSTDSDTTVLGSYISSSKSLTRELLSYLTEAYKVLPNLEIVRRPVIGSIYSESSFRIVESEPVFTLYGNLSDTDDSLVALKCELRASSEETYNLNVRTCFVSSDKISGSSPKTLAYKVYKLLESFYDEKEEKQALEGGTISFIYGATGIYKLLDSEDAGFILKISAKPDFPGLKCTKKELEKTTYSCSFDTFKAHDSKQ